MTPRVNHGKIYFSLGNLTGRVIDSETKQGVSGVRVVTDPDGFTTTTEANGSFRINNVIPGPYAIILSRPGYYSQRYVTSPDGEKIMVRGLGANDGAGELPIFSVPQVPFVRADVNNDATTDLSDAIFVLSYLFQGGSAPTCLEAANLNGDSVLDLSDAVYLLSYLFNGGPKPFPPFDECALDPAGDVTCWLSNCN